MVDREEFIRAMDEGVAEARRKAVYLRDGVGFDFSMPTTPDPLRWLEFVDPSSSSGKMYDRFIELTNRLLLVESALDVLYPTEEATYHV